MKELYMWVVLGLYGEWWSYMYAIGRNMATLKKNNNKLIE